MTNEAQKDRETVHFATFMDFMSPQKLRLDKKFRKYKGRVVPRGDVVKGDSGWHAVFTEQGSSASHMTAAKALDVIYRLPCAGQASDAVSAYAQVKNERRAKVIGITKTRMPNNWLTIPPPEIMGRNSRSRGTA